jgi:predicted kinase
MLIAMAGLPSSGKSTLAKCLERALGAVVLGKDGVRAALFPPRVLDYSAVQDEITMSAIYQAAGAILRAGPRQAVVIDGRTFLRPGQLQPLLDLAASLGERPHVIECVCDDAVARGRLERDLAEARHPAARQRRVASIGSLLVSHHRPAVAAKINDFRRLGVFGRLKAQV